MKNPFPLIGSLPKIGIRPAIDGRRKGVRESLEKQALGMAKNAAKFLSASLRYPNGKPVQCVIADSCIGGVAEAAACAEKFQREGVGLSLTVTPCWCYGSETMDMDPLIPKAVWGFNGTERPGAVYLAAVLAGYNQKGLPAFGIYGRDVQDGGDTSIPADVQEKLLRFARAGLAVAIMRGKSYLSLGGVSMGIAGSIVDQPFFESYLGMRVECVDMTEFVRRIEERIYDEREFKRAHAWTRANCKEGKDWNPPKLQHDTARKDWEWETVVKMTMIARDLMIGNPRLAELGFRRGSARPQRHRRRFPGATALDGPFPERRFHGGHAHVVVRLERHSSTDGVRHGKRRAQRRGHVVRLFADEHRANFCRRADVLESRRGQARHRPHLGGQKRKRFAASHQFRRGHARRHRPAIARRPTGDEALLGNQQGGSRKMSGGDFVAGGGL